nr:hypothetical protein [Mycobacterium ulcerans]
MKIGQCSTDVSGDSKSCVIQGTHDDASDLGQARAPALLISRLVSWGIVD